MSLCLLFKDELRGFFKSKVMIILWIGLPLLTLLIRLLFSFDPESPQDISTTMLTITVITALSGSLAAIMLSTAIANERVKGVYDLFLIRPVKKHEIVLAKYLSVMFCLIIAVSISLIVGITFDILSESSLDPFDLLEANIESLIVMVASMSISCTIGIVLGMSLDSVAGVGILSYYLGSQLSVIVTLPKLFIQNLNMILIAPLLGLSITVALLFISVLQFNKKLK
ncbi:MAG: ABC transporter permease subunit [Promethearchaeota archaeon]